MWTGSSHLNCRFKRENTILLGIIPGPSELSKDINQYLKPFVNEFQEFFQGVKLKIHGMNESQIVRCVLLGVACDMPASRKACGFLSYSALFGCTKCYKKFPGGVGQKDYSGFNRDDWIFRSNSEHCVHVREIKQH